VRSIGGVLIVYPAFQEEGEMRLSGAVVGELAERRDRPEVPLAFLFVVPDELAPPSLVMPLGRYSAEHQVWEFEPDLERSPGLVPKIRRIRT
jgi:hypothetical protein